MRTRALSIVAAALLISGCNNALPPIESSTFDQGSLLRLVSVAASDHHVPAALVYAVVEIESSGNPDAVSAHGAMGLMQLMPPTAAQCGLRQPFDPHDNLECGTAYLAQLLAQFDGNLSLAVAAYNAGPNAVLRAHGVPPKSQQYVQRVLRLYAIAAAAP